MGRTPKFRVDTAGAIGAFGLLAAAIQDSIDQSKLKGKRVPDPAEEITEALVNAVAKHFSMTVLDGDDIDRGQTSHLVLRIQTTHWGLQTAKQGGVGVVYEGTLTLVDNRSKAVLAEGMCSVYPYDGDSVEAVAQKLGDEFRGVVEYCVDDYSHRILGL